jgi:hypothetical protein
LAVTATVTRYRITGTWATISETSWLLNAWTKRSENGQGARVTAVPALMFNPFFCHESGKPTQILSKNSVCPGQDLDLAPLKYKS